MIIQDLKIKSIEEVGHIIPKGSSGTGYCQYTTLQITYENGLTQKTTIPNWYTSEQEQIQQFKEVTRRMLLEGFYVIHNQESINRFLKALGHK